MRVILKSTLFNVHYQYRFLCSPIQCIFIKCYVFLFTFPEREENYQDDILMHSIYHRILKQKYVTLIRRLFSVVENNFSILCVMTAVFSKTTNAANLHICVGVFSITC